MKLILGLLNLVNHSGNTALIKIFTSKNENSDHFDDIIYSSPVVMQLTIPCISISLIMSLH